MLQASLDSSQLPAVWKTAVITLLHKGARLLKLTIILCKCLEHILCSNMWSHIDANTILSSKQHGFRKGFSTTTQQLHVIHNATEALDRKGGHHIISFDFSKALDKVPHSLMLQSQSV